MSIRQRNGRLEVIVYRGRDPSGKDRRISRTVQGTGREAMRKAKALEAELLAEAHEARREGPDHTLAHLLDRWAELGQLEPSTRYVDKLSLDRHVRPVLGQTPLWRIRPDDLDALYRALEKGTRGRPGLSAITVRRIHGRLRSAFGQAVKWGWIKDNPAARATPPAEGHREPEAPSTADVLAFLAGLDGALRVYVWFVAATGVRRSEACAIRRSDLDLDGGSVRVRRSIGLRKGGAYLKDTKTGAGSAKALAPATVDLLREHLERQDADAEFMGSEVGDGFVFSHDDDCATPWRPDYPTKQLRSRVTAKEDPLPAVTLRGLRHWMITEGLDSGASIKAVAGRASHSRASTTLDRYAAWVPASDRDLAVTIEALLTGVADIPCEDDNTDKAG